LLLLIAGTPFKTFHLRGRVFFGWPISCDTSAAGAVFALYREDFMNRIAF
jgi:hypothetical protein